MATPTLRALRQHFGNRARLIGIMRPYVADVLAGTSWLDASIYWNRKSSHTNQRSLAVLTNMRRAHLDSIILLTNSLRTAAMAWLSGAPQRIGYIRYGRKWLLTERFAPPHDGKRLTPISAVDYYLHLAAAVGADIRAKQPELCTTADSDRQAEQFWHRQGWQDNQRVVVLNTGGAYGAAKEWPAESFATLAQRFVDHHNVRVAVICGPAERENAKRIVQLANRAQVVSLADQELSIGLSKSIVKRAHLLVSTDSGPRHFGVAFNVPTVALFGPTDPRWSDNHHPRAIDVWHEVPCGPCAQRVCPLQHHRCMRDLSIERVYEASLALMDPVPIPRVA